MHSTLYLPRKLSSHNNSYTEAELLSASNYVVVLAEPGGGKTELLSSLARQLGTTVVTANKFRYGGARNKNTPLIIDAFDELAKIDAAGIYELLGKVESINPSHFYLSSRSSEWDSSATNAFEQFLGHSPLVVWLSDFNEEEQRAIFENHAKGENFAAFQAEIARFDLSMLLPNPQFLKLFADAYIESERHFTDKRSIFSQAVERLAKEANTNIARINSRSSTIRKILLSSEIFAKILLSGAEGVCTNAATEDRMYPLLASLFSVDAVSEDLLETRLFKPGDSPDQHRPVHKIVAEYCAADYLTKRIADQADPLTLHKFLPIIAPNSTVRDELRGLLGWMASLGNKPIAEAAIELDPYAVLANGDPSQLDRSSKRLLIKRLKEIEARDPYFRRGDFWRRFSVAGFFTQDVANEIKPFLVARSDGHLRDLLLELLAGSPAIEYLIDELRQLVLSPEESKNTRLLAMKNLLEIPFFDFLPDLSVLISEASHPSLYVAAGTIESLGYEKFDLSYLVNFFRVCANLYPDNQDHLYRTIGERYFIKRLIATLDLVIIELLLDELTKDLACKCGKQSYECNCRNGISKIIGSMLDQYFHQATPPFDPIRVWQWIENLVFHDNLNADRSRAVQVLQEDNNLRQGIIAHAFGNLTDRDQILKTKVNKFDWHTHSGLHLFVNDHRFIVNLAFINDNTELWASFIVTHQPHRSQEKRGPDNLRRLMREQASKKPSFMREWVKSNRAQAQIQQKNRIQSFRHIRKMKRHLRRKNNIRIENIRYIQANRELVDSGRHWSLLVHFASLALTSPEKIEQEFGDETIVRNALRNCIDFIEPIVPDLRECAELQCASQYKHSEIVLYAACLEIMQVEGNLEGVSLRLLEALRTNINMHFDAVHTEKRDALYKEVDRLIFSNAASAENFLRQYVEPQLAHIELADPDIYLLSNDEAFSHLRHTLSIEWLKRFNDLALTPLDSIFEIAAQYGNRDELEEIIISRCADFIKNQQESNGNENIEQKRKFWFLRAWYFLKDPPEVYWDWLKTDRNVIFLLEDQFVKMRGHSHPYWPKLTSRKVEAILEAFYEKWPKVVLPNNWGTESPTEEVAYRFLTDAIWLINSDNSDDAILVLDRLLADQRFIDLHMDLKSIHSYHIRMRALRYFEPPTPQEIVNQLDHDVVVTVEGLRQLVIHELQNFQKAINGGEYNPADRFYEKGERLGEVRSTEIIAERLNLRLEPQGISVTPEHQLKDANRSDFTVTKMIGGRKRLLVTEVKGQWHNELYTAASAQLYTRYSIHPDAEQQGIFLVIWFGPDEKVAGRNNHNIANAKELKNSIEEKLPTKLKGLIDIFVLDVSRPK